MYFRRNLSFSMMGMVYILLLSFLTLCSAEIRQTSLVGDGRPLILFDAFGFNHQGRIEIEVSDISFHSVKEGPALDLSQIGFFLATEEDLVQILLDTPKRPDCVLQSSLIKKLFTLKEVQNVYKNTFHVPDSNEYSLYLGNCQPHVLLSMKVRIALYNLVGPDKHKDFLSVGQTELPKLYLSFFLIYLLLVATWIYVCIKQKQTCHRIHILMGALAFVKALNLLAEAEDRAYTRKTGTAHGWDIVFYIFGFLKGVMLFTVVILIGTGWSFLKPYLQEKEKKVIMVVIPLQVFANIAQIAIDETGPVAKDMATWRQLFLLLDIICCCAVLFPIIWSIKHLKEASHTDGKAARNLAKLTMFRQYYIVVVSYIYFTRIVVFALMTVTVFRYRWTSDLARELATLAFFIFTGYRFQPAAHNPYIVLEDDEEEAVIELPLKDDDFEL